ncbi:MAG: DUF4258 domain-containing protein [bacterium]|nr:DUF4258 domain-containing protein [bacterium]
MELVYTSHATERMAERGITADEVEQAIGSPDIQTALASRIIVVKYLQGRRLEVVTARENNKIIIITAYYAS